jgi:uncharacterized protein YkwD
MTRGVRRVVVAACAVLLLLALVAPAAAVKSRGAKSVSAANGLEYEVLLALNEVRERHGLRPLRRSPSLRAAGELHARRMATLGFFSHTSADGSPFWKRIRRFYGVGSHEYWSVGENLIWSSPDIDAAEAVRRWMQSPKHRANMLMPRWREVGLAAVRAVEAPREFDGLDVTIIAVDFGVRY